mmetsp:Transcript_17369/g.44322  ORF Transcript_17369/g.44322 Transcript_17369/m.44322 type:complete len:104 (+) Transcript_17369:254-565(+)
MRLSLLRCLVFLYHLKSEGSNSRHTFPRGKTNFARSRQHVRTAVLPNGCGVQSSYSSCKICSVEKPGYLRRGNAAEYAIQAVPKKSYFIDSLIFQNPAKIVRS